MKRSLKVVVLLLFAATLSPGQAPADSATLASIEGKTVTRDGQPLRKSILTLRPIPVVNGGRGGGGQAGPIQMPTPYSATSDAEGKFSFTGLEPGRYTLAADHPGYINTTYGIKRTAGGTQTGNSLITLTAGQHMTGATIEMIAQATIAGKVTDEDGDPLPRIGIRAMRRTYAAGGARMQMYGNATTDDQGQYKLTNLQAGRYYLSFQPQRNPAMGGSRRAGAAPGEPETDYAMSYYPGAADLNAAVAVDVGAGQDRLGTNLQMRKVPVYHVRGKIQGDLPPADGNGRLQVAVSPAGGDMISGLMNGMQMVGPDGSFDVGGLTPGTWTVSAIKAQGQLQTLNVTTVQINNRDVTDLVVAARQPMDLNGSVRIVPDNAASASPSANPSATPAGAPGGRGGPGGGQAAGGRGGGPAPRVGQVLLTPLDSMLGGAVNAMVQADGSFTLKNVGPMRYRVMVQASQQGYLKSATMDGRDVMESGMDLRNGGGILSIVYSMSAAEVAGTVTTADGPPASDATVTLVPDPVQPERTNLYKQARTDTSGAFSIKGVPPGKYKVYAWVDIEPGAYMDPDFIKPFESLGTSVKVDENDHGQVTVKQISSAQVADVNRRNGR